MTEKIDVNNICQHWIESSDNDYRTMIHLFETKDYHWSLFIGHIVIEKLLKASVTIVRKEHAPFTHDLTKLASISKLEFSEEQLDWLDTITTFNINARYDSYKQAFYKKCTPEFSKEWIEKIKKIRLWIKDRL
ncbi:MAG: HEPN domain-containing protein [Bacteroidales bacterium]